MNLVALARLLRRDEEEKVCRIMLAHKNKPILVTGAHRSGSTWVGHMIASCPKVVNLTEPFNPAIRAQPICVALNAPRPRFPADHMFHYVTEEDAEQFVDYMRKVLQIRHCWWGDVRERICPRRIVGATLRKLRWWGHTIGGHRPLVKDPIAFFSSRWLATTFDMDVIVLIRHPAAFASSLKRLNWFFPFTHLMGQPRLMQSYALPFENEIKCLGETPCDIIEHAILAWRIFHSVILQYQRDHAGWIFLRHEDLSLRPMEEFQRLFERLELPFTEKTRRCIERHTSEKNPAEAGEREIHQLKRDSRANIWNWKNRLSAQEIARIRAGTADVAHFFYSDRDWHVTADNGIAA